MVVRYARSRGQRSTGGSTRRVGGFADSGLGRNVGSEHTCSGGPSCRALGRRGARGGVTVSGNSGTHIATQAQARRLPHTCNN